jgi:hypothetical protein
MLENRASVTTINEIMIGHRYGQLFCANNTTLAMQLHPVLRVPAAAEGEPIRCRLRDPERGDRSVAKNEKVVRVRTGRIQQKARGITLPTNHSSAVFLRYTLESSLHYA